MTTPSHILPEHAVRPYSIAQLADRWGCSDSMVRKLINTGELQCFRIGILIRIPAAEVQRYEAVAAAKETATVTQQSRNPEPTATLRRVIPRAPRRPIVIDRSKACLPPRKGSPKRD
mgnify:CR=1 FL=1